MKLDMYIKALQKIQETNGNVEVLKSQYDIFNNEIYTSAWEPSFVDNKVKITDDEYQSEDDKPEIEKFVLI